MPGRSLHKKGAGNAAYTCFVFLRTSDLSSASLWNLLACLCTMVTSSSVFSSRTMNGQSAAPAALQLNSCTIFIAGYTLIIIVK